MTLNRYYRNTLTEGGKLFLINCWDLERALQTDEFFLNKTIQVDEFLGIEVANKSKAL